MIRTSTGASISDLGVIILRLSTLEFEERRCVSHLSVLQAAIGTPLATDTGANCRLY